MKSRERDGDNGKMKIMAGRGGWTYLARLNREFMAENN